MTLPRERNASIRWAYMFLGELLFPKSTPRVPKEIRQRAHRIIKHFPSDYDMDRFERGDEDVFERVEQKVKASKT